MGLLSTHLDEGISTSRPLLRGTTTDPKDLGRNIQLTDLGMPSNLVIGPSGADTEYQCVEKINEARVDERTTHLKSLNIVYEIPEADSAPKETMLTMAETNTTTSGNITGLTKHLRNANLLEIITQLDAFHTPNNSLNS
ncbi:hypothetical protein Tco_0901545 [Tanacetum coccineum]